MDNNLNLGNLMKEAQKMQQRMQEAQEALAKLTVVGQAGSGQVKVEIEMNGRHEVIRTSIPQILMEEDHEMVEDLVSAAANDAARKIEKASKDKISQLTAGMNIPTDFMKDDDKE